jgi:urate oxidase
VDKPLSLGLFDSRYGRSGVRLLKLTRRVDRHEVKDLTVGVAFEGDFRASHTEGDNRNILPTDSMQNAVYALARDHASGEIEAFALHLTRHFLDAHPHVSSARVDITEHPWTRIEIAGRPAGHAFARAGVERRTATVSRTRGEDDPTVLAGIEGLLLLRTRGAGFSGYRRDRYTTLEETDERILAAELNAEWRYGWGEVPWGLHWRQVRQEILSLFAEHESRSVLHTLYAMGRSILELCPPILEIRLRLPSRPPRPVDLSPFGMENTDEVFVPTEEAQSLVEAVVRRDELG